MDDVEGAPGGVARVGTSVSRRAAVKAVAGGALASLVWAEPTIEGLARRPAYAAAGSTAPSTSAPLSFEVVDPPVSPFNMIDALTMAATSNGTPIQFILYNGADFGEPAGTLFFTGGPVLLGCECGIQTPGPTTAAEIDYVDTDLGLTVTVAGIYTFGFDYVFVLPAGAVPTRISWTDVVVSCS